jgi:hypothetical protein
MMKKLFLLGLSCAFLFNSCKKSDDNEPAPNKAKVMFAHAAIDADTLKVQVNNTTQTSIPALPFLANSSYVSLDPGTTKLGFVFSGSGNVLKDSTVTLSANNNYSAFATGSITGRNILVTNDNLTTPASGKAKIRFINLSPSSLSTTAQVGATIVTTNLTYLNYTSFTEVSAGTYDISMGDGTNFATIKNILGQALSVGKIYTVIYTGIPAGGGNTALKLSIITNN